MQLNFVKEYYNKLDRFLECQIDVALGKLDQKNIEIHFDSLQSYLTKEQWDHEFQAVVDRALKDLTGCEANLFGFEQFSKLSNIDNVEAYLEDERQKSVSYTHLTLPTTPYV